MDIFSTFSINKVARIFLGKDRKYIIKVLGYWISYKG